MTKIIKMKVLLEVSSFILSESVNFTKILSFNLIDLSGFLGSLNKNIIAIKKRPRIKGVTLMQYRQSDLIISLVETLINEAKPVPIGHPR